MQKDVTDIELKKNYDNSFAQQKGVKFPNFGSQNYFTLKYYFININKIITKGEAEEYVSKCLNKRISDLQAVRHLASGTEYSGYSILQGGSFHNGIKLKRGQYVFTGFDKVNEQWSLQTRLAGIPNNWEECKQNFNYCCATCGSKENEINRISKQITFLEKGHKNPDFELNQSNMIPQCSYCNKKYKDRFIFDDYGQVKCLTDKELKKQYQQRFNTNS
jgi:hypothetical protein